MARVCEIKLEMKNFCGMVEVGIRMIKDKSKMKKNRLRWLRYVYSTVADAVVGRSDMYTEEGNTKR